MQDINKTNDKRFMYLIRLGLRTAFYLNEIYCINIDISVFILF